MGQIFEIKLNSGKTIIKNSSVEDSIVFEDFDPDVYFQLEFLKDGNNLVINRFEDNSSVVLINYFKQSKETALDNINGKSILDIASIIIEGKGKIYGSFLDDNIVGSSSSDTVYASDGVDDVYTYDGNDIIYTSYQGTRVDAGKGDDKIYVNLTKNGEENIFTYYKGDGNDTIYNSTSSDYISFQDMSAEDVYYVKEKNNLQIKSKLSANDSITLVDYFNSDNPIDRVLFENDIDPEFEGISLKEIENIYVIKKSGEPLSETDDLINFVGSDKNDSFVGNDSDNIYTTGKKGFTEIYSGKGNDIINVMDFSKTDTMINDSMFVDTQEASINDTLNLYTTTKGDGAFLFFDVATDEENQPKEYSPNLYITKNSNILNFMSGKMTPGFVSIENWFADRNCIDEETQEANKSSASGYIENITLNDGEIAVEEYITRVTDAVKDCLAVLNEGKTEEEKYKSAMDVLEGKSKKDKEAIISCYTKENAQITLKNNNYITYYGSNGNDKIAVSNCSTVYAGKGNDILSQGEGALGYTLYGEDGNDILNGALNATLNGGRGNNVMQLDSLSDVKITQGGGNDYLYLLDEDINLLNYKKVDNDLIIEGAEGTRATIENYFKNIKTATVKGIVDKTFSAGENSYYADELVSDVVNAAESGKLSDLLTQTQLENLLTNVGKKVTGTIYNDKIDMSESEKGLTIDGGLGDDELDGTNYNDTIIGGLGDDEITTGKGADTVTGGIGFNTIEYNDISHVAGDRITLTKGEGLTLDFSTLSGATFEYKVNGKDLDVIVSHNEETATLKLMNFAAKDITNNSNLRKGIEDTSYVKIRTEYNDGFDLREILLSKTEIEKNYNGSYLSEHLDASEYKIYTDKNKTEIQTDTTKKGLTIDGKGGNNKIIGSNYSDTIKGGSGDDYISGGLGNDLITAGSGENTIIYSGGIDTINLTKGEVLNLEIEGDITYFMAKNKNDLELIVNDDENSKVVLKNYYSRETGADVYINGINLAKSAEFEEVNAANYFEATSKIKNSYTGSALADKINASELSQPINKRNETGVTITAGAGDDIIAGSNFKDTIKAGSGNDYIVGGAGDDKLYGEGGINTFVFNDGDGQDTIYMGKGSDTIVINDSEDIAYNSPTYSRNGNNLVITYGSVTEDLQGKEIENTITVANYFSTKNPSVKTVQYAGYENGELNLSDIIVNGVYDKETTITTYSGNKYDNLIYTTGNYDYIEAGDGKDTIQINSRKEAFALGGNGDDLYMIKNLQTSVAIGDDEGFDQLVINEKSNNVNVLLEVNADGSINNNSSDLSSMLIVNDSNLNKIIKNRDVYAVTSGVEVLDAVGDLISSSIDNTTNPDNYVYEYAIDTIRTKDKWVNVQELKNAIATWLTSDGRDYSSTFAVLGAENAKSEIESLIAYCDENAWHSYN